MHWASPTSWLGFVLVAFLGGCTGVPAPAPAPSTSKQAVPPATAAAAPPAVSSAPAASEPPESATCDAPRIGVGAPAGNIVFFTSPRSPSTSVPLRVIGLAKKPLDGARLSVKDDEGTATTSSERHGGPPYFWTAEVASPKAGAYRVRLGGACTEVHVEEEPKPDKMRPGSGAWPVHAAWSRAYEDAYSAWVEVLFDAPLGKDLAWSALHEVLRDPTRNFLHDYLGLKEDDPATRSMALRPDCADLPYFLRAYFAFKMGLPFGYSSCSRGGGGAPPACVKWHSSTTAAPKTKRRDPVSVFGDFARVTLADTVHSGSGRAPADTDKGDYYPVALTLESLRPGTIFADPFGHVLVVAKRIAQTSERGGILFAVDGQPDGTVSRRRFWRGNFLFAVDPRLGGPGFKRFRPVVIEEHKARALTNAEIAANDDWGDVSLDQYAHGVEGFYDAMEDVLNPVALDPERAMREVVDTFEEQVRGRVLSVGNGTKYLAKNGAVIEMPDGSSIFETNGAWEDFSTPSRDLRLLIAIDVVRGFPARVARRLQRFATKKDASPEDVQAALEKVLADELDKRRFSYTRSDGSAFELTLGAVLTRAAALEMAYNPNDCAEVRWGATPGSPEAKPCRRHAPNEQVAKMRKTRPWFHDRRRPPRS